MTGSLAGKVIGQTTPGNWVRPVRAVFLVGFMGAGKSSVGRQLADALHWEFVDLDEQIERKAGQTVSEIFATQGEPYFRRLEAEALGTLTVNGPQQTIVSLGGGTFAQPSNVEVIRATASPVIFLDAALPELRRRCSAMQNRPLFRSEEQFRALYQSRLAHYQRADVRIDTTGKSIVQVVQEIQSLIGV